MADNFALSGRNPGYYSDMHRLQWIVVTSVLVGVALAARPVSVLHGPSPTSAHSAGLVLHANREAEDDLEVTGMIAGLPTGSAAYVSYAELTRLPQVTVRVIDDENFPGASGTLITGVPLDALARALGALPGSDLIDALCSDDYRAHYPADYIAMHHPIFALRIEHKRASAWAARTHQYDPSPYFITHAHFVAQVNVLAHREQPQVPTNIVRLNFSTAAATYGPITPRGSHARDAAVQQGFTIARQSCLRCHNQGQSGGNKAGRDWNALSTWAREQPDYFMRYVHDPQAIEPHAHMPANPAYDHATLAALDAYFRTFTAP